MNGLRKVVFLCGSRHHISDIVIKGCWYSLFEMDLCPDWRFFVDVKKALADIDTSNVAEVTELPKNIYMKEEAIEFYKRILNKKNKKGELCVTDNHKELAMGSLRLLGVKLDTNEIMWKPTKLDLRQ